MMETIDAILAWRGIRIFAVLVDASIFIAVVKWIIGLFYRTIYLKINGKIEKLEVRRKYFTVQHLTNIVNRDFYKGQNLDSEVRAEIIKLTSPRLKDEYQSEHFPFRLWHIVKVHRQVRKELAFDLSSNEFLSLREVQSFSFPLEKTGTDTIECISVSSLLHSLLKSDKSAQREACQQTPPPKRFFAPKIRFLYWNGEKMLRDSYEYVDFIKRILKYLYENDESFREALNGTKGKKLYYSRGEHNPQRSFITEREICNILMQIRDEKEKEEKEKEKEGKKDGSVSK